ncbi:MAG: peptide-methionine (S)-S-oxide reductase MsrA [Chloroflexi bacterium]|nr:peptide-methionine (S)-S-oxide reductase MsrA [Chloroflexota bacterium]
MTLPRTVPPIDAHTPDVLETATFALGCFWGPDARFGVVPGVVRTRVGYTGGSTPKPTYHDLGQHTEAIQIDYDPAAISYNDLLHIFWQAHNPIAQAYSRQYQNIIFTHDETQERQAVAMRDAVAAGINGTVRTQIRALDVFYRAEDYHQKFHLRHVPEVMGDFEQIYPDGPGFVDSTAAARANGFVSGYGRLSVLLEEIDEYGLSSRAADKLTEMARRFDH